MKPNVLLVVLDSVRSRNTSLHGYHHDTTPTLEALADEATVYEEARAPGVWSLPSHASMFTGEPVTVHGVVDENRRLDSGYSVFEELRNGGYRTGVFSDNPFITTVDTGLSRGFDTVHVETSRPYHDALDPTTFVNREGEGEYLEFLRHCLDHSQPVRSLLNGVHSKVEGDVPGLSPDNHTGFAYARAFDRWRASTEGPWAACLNLMDAHFPYEPGQEYDLRSSLDTLSEIQCRHDQKWEFLVGERPDWELSSMEPLYDGAIRQADAVLSTVLDDLRDADAYDETLVIVTADHGDGLGERSYVGDRPVAGHVADIHEAQFHVPLVVKHPGQEEAQQSTRPVSLTIVADHVRSATLDGPKPDPSLPTVASAGASSVTRDTFDRARPGNSLLSEQGFASYRRDGGELWKLVNWEGSHYDVLVHDRCEHVIDSGPNTRAAALGDIKLPEEGLSSSGGDELSDEALVRLERLGYR